MSRSERIAVAVTAAVSLIFRAAAFFRYRFDSDEPQHLHVAWGWTAGLVQYRDVSTITRRSSTSSPRRFSQRLASDPTFSSSCGRR